MPQLMPMFWKSSILMSFMLLLVLIIFYNFKMSEYFMKNSDMNNKIILFEFMW
uniref:ATP synthase F0 subunit 8 n=1 Tax=Oxyopes licenti TaxID=1112454 RepID=A0A7M3UZ49_9ARAC|nr:ATP synthase F0 subunit 8 [Oxyopes licenti]QOL12226.1 ATP synthase F0 subunit 8 [Oxyopes licenti]